MLKIVTVRKNGGADKEYVLLQATEAGRTGGYAIIDNTYRDGELSNTFRHNYFFPDVKVAKGEFVSLWTGEGPDGQEYVMGETKDGDPVHRFYWGSDAPVWNDAEDDAVHLIRYEVVDRTKKKADKPKS